MECLLYRELDVIRVVRSIVLELTALEAHGISPFCCGVGPWWFMDGWGMLGLYYLRLEERGILNICDMIDKGFEDVGDCTRSGVAVYDERRM